jgi:hypothetical protein
MQIAASAIRQAKTIEEAKKELLNMVQEATVEWGDVIRISKGTKSRAAAKQLQEHESFGHEQRFTQLECRPRDPRLGQARRMGKPLT